MKQLKQKVPFSATKHSVKSLNKALDVLEVLLDLGGTEMPLSELAQLYVLNKATVSRGMEIKKVITGCLKINH